MKTTNFQLDIVALLVSDITKSYTIREISQTLKKNYRNTYEAIQDLATKKIIKKNRVGRADACSLDIKENAATDILARAEDLRKEDFVMRYKPIKALLNDIVIKLSKYTAFYCLVVFGSYAEFKARENSDLDVLVIAQDLKHKKDFIKEISSLQTLALVKISAIIIDENEFAAMLNSKEEVNVGKETVKKHIILYNSKIYWEMVKNAL